MKQNIFLSKCDFIYILKIFSFLLYKSFGLFISTFAVYGAVNFSAAASNSSGGGSTMNLMQVQLSMSSSEPVGHKILHFIQSH